MEQKKRPVISVVMPAYNSGSVIEKALRSIRMQTIDQDLVEILVIDGGSDDGTLAIARQYGATVLHNEKRLPEHAKSIGLKRCLGQYAIMTDTDEEFTSPNQFSDRLALLRKHPQAKAVAANRRIPAGNCGTAGRYMNIYEDPFTAVIYRLKETKLESFSKWIDSKEGNAVLLRYNENALTPIGDGATTMLDMDYVRERFADTYTSITFACISFLETVQACGWYGCIEGDDVLHHSTCSLKVYLSKLRFRVINNLWHQEESGFTARAKINRKLARRKMLFPLYAVTIILPLLDSIKMAVRHKDATMLLHFFYVQYVFFYTAWCMMLKGFGKQKTNKTYGKQPG